MSKILDSGDRTVFDSGAVRDMHAGKGKFDLMPLDILSNIINSDRVLYELSCFMGSCDSIYLYRAIHNALESGNDDGNRMFNGCVYTMLLEVAVHFEEGAAKYGRHNWQRGIPIDCYVDSAVRHYIKWLRGDDDERHDRAFMWNLICCIWETKQNRNIERSDT